MIVVHNTFSTHSATQQISQLLRSQGALSSSRSSTNPGLGCSPRCALARILIDRFAAVVGLLGGAGSLLDLGCSGRFRGVSQLVFYS